MLVIVALNGDYARRWRWAQAVIVVASASGIAVSLFDRSWLFGAAYLIAGVTSLRRLFQADPNRSAEPERRVDHTRLP